MTRRRAGIDVGGTKCLGVVLDEQGLVVAEHRLPTPKSPDGIIDTLAAVAGELGEYDTLGLGVPGLITRDGSILASPNLTDTNDFRVGPLLSERLGHRVWVENDATCATVAEWMVGAAQGVDDFMMVTLGTGIGGGVILGGKVYEGSRGSAGEIGHMVTMADGPFAVGGGVRGGIEAIASRSAIERELRAGLAVGRLSILNELMREKDGALTSSVLAKAVMKQDPLTIEVLQRAAHYLGLHAASLINAFDPQALIYGGGVIESLGEWMLAQIRSTALQYTINRNRIDEVQIIQAKLGDDAGVVGAALLALD